MGVQEQHDPDLLPLLDADSLADWESVAAPGSVRLGMTVSVRFDPDSAAVVRSDETEAGAARTPLPWQGSNCVDCQAAATAGGCQGV